MTSNATDSNRCWRIAKRQQGGSAKLTGNSITTVRHGLKGERPEILFSLTLEEEELAVAPMSSRSVGTSPPSSPSPSPPLLPTKMQLRFERLEKSFNDTRISEIAWDAQSQEEKLRRLEEERKTWPDATLETVRTASTFRILISASKKGGSGSLQQQQQQRQEERLVEFYVYVCGRNLEGGTVTILSLDPPDSSSSHPTNNCVSIPWRS